MERSHLSPRSGSQAPWTLPGPHYLSQDTAPGGQGGRQRGSDHPQPPPARICPFSVRKGSEQLRAKLPNTLPGGPAAGEEPGPLLGWGGGLTTPHAPLRASPVPNLTRTLRSQTSLLGKLTINETSQPRLWQGPPSSGPFTAPSPGLKSPWGLSHSPRPPRTGLGCSPASSVQLLSGKALGPGLWHRQAATLT